MSDYFFSYHFFRDFLISFPSLAAMHHLLGTVPWDVPLALWGVLFIARWLPQLVPDTFHDLVHWLGHGAHWSGDSYPSWHLCHMVHVPSFVVICRSTSPSLCMFSCILCKQPQVDYESTRGEGLRCSTMCDSTRAFHHCSPTPTKPPVPALFCLRLAQGVPALHKQIVVQCLGYLPHIGTPTCHATSFPPQSSLAPS